MSLLMEALRKAEAAKNKKDDTQSDQDSKLSLQPMENAEPSSASQMRRDTRPTADADEESLEQFEFTTEATESAETEQEADSEDDDIEFYSAPADSRSNAFESEPDADDILEKLDEKAGGVDELHGYFAEENFAEPFDASPLDGDTQTDDADTSNDNFDTMEAAEEFREFERSKAAQRSHQQPSSDQAMLDRQTANSLFLAKRNSQKAKRQRIALLSILLALFPIGGGVYWFYATNLAGPALFPATVQNTIPPLLPEPAATTDALPAGAPEPATPVVEATLADNVNAAVPLENDSLVAGNETVDASVTDDGDVGVVGVVDSTAQSPVVVAQLPPAAPPAGPQPSESVTTGTDITPIQLTRTTRRTQVSPDLMAAYESYQQNNLEQAQRLYTQVLQSQPNNRDALLGLALINRQQGNVQQAQALYSRILQLNPRDPLARAGLLESGRDLSPSQQEIELQALQADFPDVAPLAYALGNLYASQSRWNEAQNAYFEALMIATENDPNAISPDYAFNLAVSLERLNQLNLALSYYQQALSLSASAPSGFSMESLNRRLAYLEGLLE